jgi:phage-related tail protein
MAEQGTEVGSLYYDLDIPTDKLDKSLGQADKSVKDFGDNVGTTGEEIKNGLNKAAVGFAVVGAGLTLASKQATDYTVDLVNNSKNLGRQIGVSTTEASRLVAALGRVGISSDEASASFGIFSKNIVAATENADANKLATQKLQLQIDDTKKSIAETTAEIKKHGDKSGELNSQLKVLNNTLAIQEESLKKTSDGFSKLGISTKDTAGIQKGFTQLLFEVADKFKAMPDGIDKTALSMELFGRQGKDMIKVLNLGSTGIQDLQAKADELGLTLNEQTIGTVAAYIQAQKDLKDQTNALKLAIGMETIPVLTALQSTFNNVIFSLIGTDGPLKTLVVDFIAFGGPVLAATSAVLAFGANLVGAWPAITGTITAVRGLIASVTLLGTLSIAAWSLGVITVLASVTAALYSVKGAWDAVNNAAKAASANNDAQIQGLLQQANAARARGDAAAAARYANAIRAIGGNAAGTDNWKGGPTWVHEKGPEIIDLPQGTRIIPHELSKDIVGGGGSTTVNIGTVNDRSDADYILRRMDRNNQRVSRGLSPA